MSVWVTKLLFAVTVGCGSLLLLCVLTAPIVDSGKPVAHGTERILSLFARDSAVRRTAVAAAIGLFATAAICFRPKLPLIDAVRGDTREPWRHRTHSR